MMQKRAGWFWPSKPKDPGAEGQLPANAWDLDSVNDLYDNVSKKKPLRVEGRSLTPEQLRQEQWKIDTFNNTSWWNPLKKWQSRPTRSTARFLEDHPMTQEYINTHPINIQR